MDEFVKLIVSLSISGGIMALALFALKPLLRHRLSKSFQYYIWLIVLMRLALPFTLEVNLVNTLMNDTAETVVQMGHILTADDDSESNNSTADISAKANEMPAETQFPMPKAAVNYPFAIWLFGTTFSLGWGLISYRRFIYALKRSNNPAKTEEVALLKSLFGKRRISLYQNPMAKTPMLIGIFRPAIVLPEAEYTEAHLRNILSHEIIHLRRFDIAIRWVTTLVAAAHWFNPIVYFMRREINRACELSCDEAVIKSLDQGGKQSYGETLISVVAESRYPYGVISTTMCEEKKTLKERLVSIMQYKTKTKRIVIISVVLLLLLTVGALALGAKVANETNEVMSADVALTELKNSIEYADSNLEISFQIPSEYPPDNWNIIVAGREEIEDFGGMSAHFFEEENSTHSWVPGKRYIIPMSGKNYTDLLMSASLPGENGNPVQIDVDLLPFVKSKGFSTNPVEQAMPGFEQAEIDAARAVVEEYYRAQSAKDDDALWKTVTGARPENAMPLKDVDVEISLLSIDFDPQDSMRETYVQHGRGSVTNTSIENVIVFKTSFNVKYTGQNTAAWNEGDSTNWSMILIRENKDLPWLIDDQGY